MRFIPIIKPVGGKCNLECAYCYFQLKSKPNSAQNLMGDEILGHLMTRTCELQDHAELLWHGGEPLLAGIDFYQKVVDVQANYRKQGKTFGNAIQTNGYLINQDWIDFFSSHRFKVGTSLDGPSEFHDQTRTQGNGQGSHAKILNSIRELQNSNLLGDTICCVSSVNCLHAKQILDFFVAEGIKKLKFIPVEGRDDTGRPLSYSVTGEQYAHFMISIFDRWLEIDDPEIEIREIKSIVDLMLGGNYRECTFANCCQDYFTVYPDGEIYGCDSLPKVKYLHFGNVNKPLKAIQDSLNFKRFTTRAREIKKGCIGCKWVKICCGGCLQDWWPDINNPNTKNMSCKGFDLLFSHINKTLKFHGMI